MEAHRLLPLPARYQRMKERHLSSYGERGFKGYRSPWIPVADSNLGLVKKGDLVISSHDMKERPFIVGRGVEVIEEGSAVGRIDQFEEADRPPILVWADSHGQEAEKLLDGNPFADNYAAYSKAMEAMLRTAHSRGIRIVEEVKFPIYHETDINNATNIWANGICYGRVSLRRMSDYNIQGTAFCAGRNIKKTLGLGNLHGALVEFSASSAFPPHWIDLEETRTYIAIREFLLFLSKQKRKVEFPEEPLYAWYVVCAELSASAFASGRTVCIFDHFEKYRASQVLKTEVAV